LANWQAAKLRQRDKSNKVSILCQPTMKRLSESYAVHLECKRDAVAEQHVWYWQLASVQ